MIVVLRQLFSKIAALGLLAAVAYAIVVPVAIPAFQRLSGLDQEIAQKRLLLGNYLAAAREQGPAETAAPVQALYLEGETDALRLANLQTLMSEAARANHVRLASARGADPAEQEGVRLIGLHAQLSAEIGQLQSFLYDLEVKNPHLVVNALHILRAPRVDGENVGQSMPRLDVTLHLAGAAAPKEE